MTKPTCGWLYQPLVTEAPTLEPLQAKIRVLIPELLEVNHRMPESDVVAVEIRGPRRADHRARGLMADYADEVKVFLVTTVVPVIDKMPVTDGFLARLNARSPPQSGKPIIPPLRFFRNHADLSDLPMDDKSGSMTHIARSMASIIAARTE